MKISLEIDNLIEIWLKFDYLIEIWLICLKYWLTFQNSKFNEKLNVIKKNNQDPSINAIGRRQVSLISKMVPSPDWFIGIDSFDLCVNGKWLDGITIEVINLNAHLHIQLARPPGWHVVLNQPITRCINNIR